MTDISYGNLEEITFEAQMIGQLDDELAGNYTPVNTRWLIAAVRHGLEVSIIFKQKGSRGARQWVGAVTFCPEGANMIHQALLLREGEDGSLRSPRAVARWTIAGEIGSERRTPPEWAVRVREAAMATYLHATLK